MAQGKKKNPEFVIARDQRILRREIAKWTRSKELALQQIFHLREIFELSQKARAYLMTASTDLILQLYNGENWGTHPELAYIYKMRELFLGTFSIRLCDTYQCDRVNPVTPLPQQT